MYGFCSSHTWLIGRLVLRLNGNPVLAAAGGWV
jgi:hypothetical protein